MDLVSDKPYWPINSGLIHSYPALDHDVKCDVIVLGAGITGALCAYHLGKEDLDVVVIDKRDVASGSTSASTAMLQYEIDTPLTDLIERMGKSEAQRAYQVCLESIGKIANLVTEIKSDCGFTWKSSVYVASTDKEVKDLEAEYRARKEAGIELSYLTQSDVEEKFSFSRPAALLSPVAAEVDAYRLAHDLLHRSRQLGVRIFDRTRMKDYRTHDRGITITSAAGSTIEAKWAVFATGYEAVEILDRKVVDLKSSFALVSEPLQAFPGWWDRCLLWETARPYFYMRTTADGRAMVGGEDEDYRNPIRRDASVPKKAAKLEKRFREMFPDIDFQPAYAWAGTFGETKDGLAYIGSVPELPNCHFTLGFGGNGITYSIIAAEIIRDSMLGRPNRDASLFRFDR